VTERSLDREPEKLEPVGPRCTGQPAAEHLPGRAQRSKAIGFRRPHDLPDSARSVAIRASPPGQGTCNRANTCQSNVRSCASLVIRSWRSSSQTCLARAPPPSGPSHANPLDPDLILNCRDYRGGTRCDRLYLFTS
jgi:hypothetical protein